MAMFLLDPFCTTNMFTFCITFKDLMVNTYLWTRSIKVAGRGHEEAGVAGGGGEEEL